MLSSSETIVTEALKNILELPEFEGPLAPVSARAGYVLHLHKPTVKPEKYSPNKNDDVPDGGIERPPKRYASMMESETKRNQDCCHVPLSQPLPSTRVTSIYELVNNIKSRREQLCFSQPVHNDDLFLGSQIQFTQSPVTKENFGNLVKRMTRFYVKSSYEKTLELLCGVLDKYHFNWSIDPSGAISIVTVDEMKNPLSFKANFINMEGKLLLDFRLSKGCGLDFKKKFIKIREGLKGVID